ncbi:MAG: 23S rRNA (guanosine(2251)-2'-O)-methyltransferase RlmB [Porticoccaceae bacterium]|nr:23S rRNA (guanosine(2251)-2'-O)-methyltransferase RlmB [Porticoccaceae bacterium]
MRNRRLWSNNQKEWQENFVDWIYGIHAVQTMLKSAPQRVRELHVQRGRQDDRLQKIHRLAEQHGVALQWATVKQLDSKAQGRHQGVMALCSPGETYDETFLLKLAEEKGQAAFFLMLDGVTDPHNLGACLRSADGAGVQAVIVPKDSSVGLTPVVSKVACGAAETVPLVMVTNLNRTLEKLQQQGAWVVGTAGEAEQTIYELDLKGPLVLVMGAEGTGMRQLVRRQCDFLGKLPMAGEVSSLNVSVATGVCLFEVVRQRQAAT